ncbi:unnamed protein product [Linum tenue]|uniref:Phytocyanin domain-containing protein n=1 Tax=Linum tenue TaxID=586396 RepID=A0AAV0JJQ3_9ROSI|nr:unnamed protein product [Linum tenue]
MASSSHRIITLLLASVVAASFFLPSSMALSFDVGGKDGWVVKPSESYDHWAQRLRFQVNDSLVFKYKEGSDSVVQVKKEDYDSCDTSKKLKVMKSGTSVFSFPQSGPFYFISGNKKQCLAGQKLIVVVLAVRSPPKTPTAPPSPAPALPPTASQPPSSAPAGAPDLAPQPSGGSSPPSTAPSQGAAAPGGSPAGAPSNSPATAPSQGTVSPAGAPAGTSNSPVGQPGGSPPGPPGLPGSADQTSPPEAAKNSSSAVAVVIASPALVAVGLGFIALFI